MRKHRERHVPKGLAEGESVVGRLWARQGRVLVGDLGPVEAARVNNDPSQRAALAGQELRGAVHDQVRPELYRPAEVRRRQGVVDDERHLRGMRQVRYRPDVAHHTSRVCQTLRKEEADGGVLKRLPHLLVVVNVHERALPVELLDGLAKLRNAAPVELVRGHDAVARLHEAEEGHELRGVARGRAGGAPAAFEACHSLLQDSHGRVREPAVDVAEGGEVEERGCVVDVLEHI
mmetsp:Transcript_55872/g.149569  ORF Transcript_55872/g.149569 Transcript_55872/m.149569 type:complete len:233 (-) Transcript_55872:797-1495(-)